MRLRKKKSFMDQAGETLSEYVETVKPQLESALAAARESTKDFVEGTARPMVAEAREKAGPALADARVRAAESLAEAREKAGPAVADARAKAAPVLASGAALAGAKAHAVRELADAKLSELKGEPVKKKKSGKLRKVLVFATVAGVAGLVAKKLQGDKASDNWQSSYVPAPPPTTPAPPASPAAPAATAGGTVGGASVLTDEVDDTGGASPDEALADQSEEPHPITTPDEPATVVDLGVDEPRP